MNALRGRPLAVALESMLWGFGITKLDELAEAIRFDGNFLAEYTSRAMTVKKQRMLPCNKYKYIDLCICIWIN